MPLPLDQQTIIVTGAAQGLGAAVAQYLAGQGAQLILMDNKAEGVSATASACGGRARAIVADLTSAEDTRRAIGEALDGIDHVDTLIHNAAILLPEPFLNVSLERFQQATNVGLQAGFLLAQAVWPGMVKAGGGALIFVSSQSGIKGFVEETAYCAAKHGLEGFSKCLAMEGAEHGITSSTITPGMYMHTPMSERTYPPELRQKWIDPARLAPAFGRIATERSGAFNGQRLNAWELVQEQAA